MRIEHLLISVAVFIAVLTLGVSMYIEQTDNYGVSNDQDLFAGINLTSLDEDYKDHQSDLSGSTLGGGSEIKEEDTESSIYKDAIGQVKKVGTSVSNTEKIITVASKEIGIIPSFITDLWVRVVIILSLSFLIYMIARFKPQRD